MRNTNVSSGASLITSFLVLAAALFGWIYLQLNRIALYHELLIQSDPPSPQTELSRKYEELKALISPAGSGRSWAAVSAAWKKVHIVFAALAGAAGVSWFLIWWRMWLPVSRCSIVSFGMLALIVAVVTSILLEVGRLIRLWKVLHSFNEDIADLPLIAAFDRIPSVLASGFGKWMFLERPRSGVWPAVSQQLQHLERILSGAGRLTAPTNCRQIREAIRKINLRPVESFQKEPSEVKRQRHDKDVEEVFDVVRAIHGALHTQVWPTRSANKSYNHTDAMEVAKEPEKSDRAKSADAEWIIPAEDLVAMFAVVYLSQFRLHLKNLAWFLLIAPMSLLFAVTIYPFQPQFTLLWNVIAVATAALAALAYVFFGMNRDELISRITRTKAKWITLDAQFLQSFGVFVVPLALMLLFQIPGVGDTVRGWMESLGALVTKK